MTPSDPAVTSTYTRKLSTTSTASDSIDSESSGMGTAALIGLAVVALIVIFGLAIWLTRESDEEVERDIFEYCPACDGELEGDENRCPHCSFNLAKARKQFHSCKECGESVPDLMDNCPYCGSKQDVSSYFEQRQRRERKVVPKEEVALPEVDDDQIVTGTENFDEAVKEFGYDEEQFGDHWDEKIATAEAEIAEIEQLEEITLKEFVLENKNKNINLIALEDVSDPRNIGSIIRSAVAFNIHGIIVKERSFPSKSKLLYKSASGGTEHLRIFKVSNINTSLKFLKTKDFWISAFDSSAKKNFITHKWIGKNVLLFGSEGFGLKNKTLEHSDFVFKINISKKIESLNISNSVSVVCHYIDSYLKKNE